LDALERIEKIIRENAFEKKKPGLKFNRGLALPAFEQLGLGEEPPFFFFAVFRPVRHEKYCSHEV